MSAEEWRRILRQLIARDIVRVEAHNMGGLTLGQARGLLKGDEQIFIRSTQKPAKRRRRVFEELTGEDLVIFERLKQWRREKASETGKLPYQSSMTLPSKISCGSVRSTAVSLRKPRAWGSEA